MATVNVTNILFCLTSCYVRRCSSTGMNARSTHITQINFIVFPPPKNWGFFFHCARAFMTQFFTSPVPSHAKHKKNASESVLEALKSILDRHLDLFVFLEAKMQGYNRAPLLDRLKRYSQVAFLIQFVNARS